MIGEPVEALGPEALILVDPVGGAARTFRRVGRSPAPARPHAVADEDRPVEHARMPGDRDSGVSEGDGGLARS